MKRDKVMPKVRGNIPGINAVMYMTKHMKHAAQATYIEGVVRDGEKWAGGCFFTDVDGNVLLDFACHVGASPLGYKHPEIMKIKRKLLKYDPDRYAGTDFVLKADVPTSTDLHSKLHEITSHLEMDTHFFSNSGAEAVENAIKICYDFRQNYGYGIAFEGAFHGRTLGALSLNWSKKAQKKWYPSIPNIERFPYCECPHDHFCRCGWMKYNAKKGKRVSGLEDLLSIRDPNEIAYIILEPLQGEGGYKIPGRDFIKSVYNIARVHEIPVISDEIQAGLGRTGKWWAIEHFNVMPDVITSAKALGIGATISRREMFPSENGRISSTWGEGNLMASAIGYTTIDVIQKEGLLSNADEMGRYLRGALRKLDIDLVSNVRGLGLMDAIDAITPEVRDGIVKQALDRGLVLMGCGARSIRFLPPLDVRKREIDIAVEILDDTLRNFRF